MTKDLASNDNLEISLAVLEDEDFEPEPEVEDELRPSLLGSRVPRSLWMRLNRRDLEAAAVRLAVDPEATAWAKSRLGNLVLVSTASAKAV